MADDQGTKELSQATAPATGSGTMLESFDLADDSKLLTALSKRVTQTFTYKVNGKHGLSSAGALWASREFAKQGEVYRVEGDVKIEPCPLDPDFINVTLKVARYFVHPGTGQEIKLDTTVGHKRMGRKTKRYLDESGTDFEMVEDPEFTTKAITKAERNGKLKLMPKDAILNLITKAIAMSSNTSSTPKNQNQNQSKGAAAKPSTPPAEPKKEEAKKAEEPKKEEAKKEEAKKPEEPKKDASAPAQPPKETAPAAASDGKPKMSREVMIQKLDAVCKMVFNTQDGAVARQKLAAITGKASPSDLTDDEIKKVGNAINAVAKKTATIEGNNIVRTSDKVVLWKGPEVKAPPAAEAPAQPEKEEEMF